MIDLWPMLILYSWIVVALWMIGFGLWHTGRQGRSARSRFFLAAGSQHLLIVLILGWVWWRQFHLEVAVETLRHSVEQFHQRLTDHAAGVQQQLDTATLLHNINTRLTDLYGKQDILRAECAKR